MVPPSANVTVPVGGPEPLAEATVAVKVTACPTLSGLTEKGIAVGVVGGAVGLQAGDVAVIAVALLTVNEVALELPNLTAAAQVKLLPVMVTLVPPGVGPVFGLTLVTVGAGT